MQTNLFSGETHSGTTSATSSAIAASAGADGPSELFTKLLVAQIRNQNPLEPTDPSQFVNQLTQLSQMESLQQLASQASANANMLYNMQVMALGGQVGSSVSVATDRVALTGQPVQAGFSLQDPSADVTVVLTGADGSERRIELGSQPAGAVRFAIDPTRLGLPDGTYALRVDAASKESPAVQVDGELSSVKVSATGGVVLNVANVGDIAPAAITQFNGRAASATNP
jgi:flagellar basal-body rod modification protein FlgD